MAEREEEAVVVATFNVLAPCYSAKEGGHQAARRPREWVPRQRVCVLPAIADLRADVICLQEFWFSPSFLVLYETEMARLGCVPVWIPID